MKSTDLHVLFLLLLVAELLIFAMLRFLLPLELLRSVIQCLIVWVKGRGELKGPTEVTHLKILILFSRPKLHVLSFVIIPHQLTFSFIAHM